VAAGTDPVNHLPGIARPGGKALFLGGRNPIGLPSADLLR